MSSTTLAAPTIWQRSIWWIERLTRQTGNLSLLLSGVICLALGLMFYIAVASTHAQIVKETREVAQALSVEQQRRVDVLSRLEELRSPQRLTTLAKKYSMVSPTPRRVWRVR